MNKETMPGVPEGWRWLAMIIDGEVVSKMAWDPKLSAIIQSNPIVIDVTDKWDHVFEGYFYDGENFIEGGEEVEW